jgi:hypothetical protein
VARRRYSRKEKTNRNDYYRDSAALRRRAKEAAIDRYRQDVQTFRDVAVEQLLGCRSVVEMLDAM